MILLKFWEGVDLARRRPGLGNEVRKKESD